MFCNVLRRDEYWFCWQWQCNTRTGPARALRAAKPPGADVYKIWNLDQIVTKWSLFWSFRCFLTLNTLWSCWNFQISDFVNVWPHFPSFEIAPIKVFRANTIQYQWSRVTLNALIAIHYSQLLSVIANSFQYTIRYDQLHSWILKSKTLIPDPIAPEICTHNSFWVERKSNLKFEIWSEFTSFWCASACSPYFLKGL